MHAEEACPAHNIRRSAPSNANSKRIFAHAERFQVPHKKTQGRPHNAPQRACSRCRCTRKRVLLTTYAAQPHVTTCNAISERIFAHAQRFQVPQKHTNKTPPKKTQGHLHNAPQRACTRCRCTQKRVLLTTYATQPHLTQTPSEFSRRLKGFRSHKSIQTKPHPKRPRDARTMHLSAHEDGR